ncbi:Putative odorant receptor 22c [Camponotus floridanus]|uniref:Putative odorant receptor 22c n=1 Tax=Camponotus floridanus TaxID=104421 RepID=E2AR38_CAMFO|nr:Putative odorant receptor 22c [Camponotus floridanus]
MTVCYVFPQTHIIQYVQYIRTQTKKHFSNCQFVTINVTLSIQAYARHVYYSSHGNSHNCYARRSGEEREREEERDRETVFRSMESNMEYYYNINKRLLSLIGQWPYQKPKEKWAFLILILIIVTNLLITQIKVLTDRLFIDMDMFENQDERKIMKRYAESGRWYTLTYASYVYIATLSFATTALIPRILDIVSPLNTSRPIVLAYPAYYFVNEEKYFYYIFCHMFVTAGLGLTGLIAHDCMLFAYIEHVCGLFAVIGFAVLLESTFTVSFAIQILIVTVGMSITLVQIGKFIQCDKDVQCILTVIPTHLFQLVVIVKLYTCQFNNSKIKDLTDKVYSDWKSVEIPEECEIMKTYAAKARLFTLIYTYNIYNQKIALSVHAHWRALQFAELLEDTFSITFIIQILINTAVMSVTLLKRDCEKLKRIYRVLEIAVQLDDAMEAVRYIAFVIGQLIHLFCFSLQGQRLIDHSLQMRDKIYSKLLEDTFNMPFAAQMLIATIVMSVTLLQISRQDGELLDLIRYMLYVIVYCIIAVFIFVSISLIPFVLDIVSPLNQSRPVLLPYPGYYFVDIHEYFWQIFWHSLVAWQILTIGMIAHDCMYVTFVEHICSMFSVIGFAVRLESIIFTVSLAIQILIVTVGMSITLVQIKDLTDRLFMNWDMLENQEEREIMRKYTKTGKWYALIYACKFAILLENTFSLSFGIQMLIAVVGMSISLVQFTMQLHDFGEAMRYMLFIGGQLIHLFCYSFQGQKLINHSTGICDKIYNGSWYEIPITAQRLLLMVMRKGIEASTFTAGKIYVFSLANFTAVLQTSMSYFTVLSSFNE